MNLWVSADWHQYHNNIRRLCNRPFNSIEEMNEILIENYNKVVKPNDSFIHAGDFAPWVKADKVITVLKRMNGTKNLIFGNHDHNLLRPEIKQYVNWIKDYYELNIDKHMTVFSHYAFRVWNQSHRGSYHCYGHSHGTLPDDINALSIDIGVDAVAMREGMKPENYRPLHFEEVRDFMKKKAEKINVARVDNDT